MFISREPRSGPRDCPGSGWASSSKRRGPCGYCYRVSTPNAVQVARLSRVGLCVAVALALSLTCIGFAVAATTPMPGMVDMAIASKTAATTAAPVAAVGSFTSGLTDDDVDDMVREEVSPGTSVMSLPMSSVCDSVCVTDVSEMCMVAGGLTVMTLLALLVAARRDTLVGLLARARPPALPHRRRLHTPWSVLSPISLCVLRV